ncbi:DNA-primase RepB domain-containing protein [Roseateles sp. DB2]|uniref:DNA-primase RepB domain-containing protein n=1 Tax=Roseateles sp. DB2 TaxID=3453717 RepID=UPI003EEE36E1
MSARLAQALRRVVLRGSDGQPWSQRASKPVLDVLTVLCDAALDQDLHAPVRLFVEEVARRASRKVRSTQTALAVAAELGLVWRLPEQRTEAIRRPWGCLIHPALILIASTDKKPGRRDAPKLFFPRPWTADLASFEVPEVGQESTGAECDRGALNAPKKVKKTIHSPPLARAVHGQLRLSGAGASIGWSVKEPSLGALGTQGGACGPGREAGPGRVGQVGNWVAPRPTRGPVAARAARDEGAARAEASVSPFARLVKAKPLAPDGAWAAEPAWQADAFWSWLTASLRPSGWAGAVEFLGQKRLRTGPKAGQRGAPYPVPGAKFPGPISKIQDAWPMALAGAAARRGEVVMRLLGEHPLLLVDDLRSDQLPKLLLLGPAAVLETSPDNFQASLVAPRCLTGDERAAANRALARRLGADQGATGRDQLRRVPGSMNAKPALSEPFCSRYIPGPLPGTISDELLAQLLVEGQQDRPQHAETMRSAALPDVAAMAGRRPERTNDSDEDWKLISRQLRSGIKPEAVVDQIAALADERGKWGGGARARAYAERSVDEWLRRYGAELSRRRG